jgi:hypothetical protein
MDTGNDAVSIKDNVCANLLIITNGSFSGFIRDFVLVGSNDGYTWTNLYEGESVLSASLTEIAITITGNTNYYYYLRLIIKSINRKHRRRKDCY